MKDASGSLVQIIPQANVAVPSYTGATSSAAGSAGLVPAAQSSEREKFLRGDGTWQEVSGGSGGTSSPYQGATANADGVAGLVPAATIAEKDKYLKGDGTWGQIVVPTVSNYVGATASASGTAGLVPAATSAEKDYCLKGDGTWSNSGLISNADQTKLNGLSQYPRIDDFHTSDSYNFGRNASVSTTGPTRLVIIGGDGIETTLINQAADSSTEASIGVRLTVKPDAILATSSGLGIRNGKLYAPIYGGADDSNDGTAGLVPAATSAEKDYCLKGDGTWGEVASTSAKEIASLDVEPTASNTSDLDNGSLIFWNTGSAQNAPQPVYTSGNQTISGVKTFTAGIFGGTVAMSGNAIDCAAGTSFTKTITGSTTFSFTNVPSDATCCVTLILRNGGNYTVTWPASVKWTEDTIPDLMENGTDVLTFITCDGGVTWYGTTTCIGVSA